VVVEVEQLVLLVLLDMVVEVVEVEQSLVNFFVQQI
jgi:hypothetical protein